MRDRGFILNWLRDVENEEVVWECMEEWQDISHDSGSF